MFITNYITDTNDANDNIITQTFGYLGASTLIITLLPQIYLTYKTKKVENLSLGVFMFTRINLYSIPYLWNNA